MSWFKTSGLDFSGLAKTALAQAQKSIDKVLDIQDDNPTDKEKDKAKVRKPLPRSPSHSSRGNDISKEKKGLSMPGPSDRADKSSSQSDLQLIDSPTTKNKNASSLKLDNDDSFFDSFFEQSDKDCKIEKEKLLQSQEENVHSNVSPDEVTKPESQKSKLQAKIPPKLEVLESNTLVKNTGIDKTNLDEKVKPVGPSTATQETVLLSEDNVIQKESCNVNETKSASVTLLESTDANNTENYFEGTQTNAETKENLENNSFESPVDIFEDKVPEHTEETNEEIVKEEINSESYIEISLAVNKEEECVTDSAEIEEEEEEETQVIETMELVEENVAPLTSDEIDAHVENSLNTSVPVNKLMLKERPLSTSTPQAKHDELAPSSETSAEIEPPNQIPSDQQTVDLADTSFDINKAESVNNDMTSTDYVNIEAASNDQSEQSHSEENLSLNIVSFSDNILPNDKDNNIDAPMSVNSDQIQKTESMLDPVNTSNEDVATDAMELKEEYVPKELEVDSLRKEIARLQEVVSAREAKMVILSKENIDMQETAAILRSQLNQLELTRKTDDSEMDEMRLEFARRITETDQKLQSVIKERNALQQSLEETELRLTTRLEEQETVYSNALKEKEQQIIDLLEEGEKLSKRELKSNTVRKKLKSKVQELEQQLVEHKKRLEESEKKEADHLESIAKAKETEKEMRDKITTLEALTDSQEDEISHLKEQLDDAEEKQKEMQTNLDSAYIELHHVSLEKAQQLSEVQEATLHDAMKERENLQRLLDETIRKAKVEKEQLQLEVEDLQSTITRMNMSICRKEENYKAEIKEGLQRLQDAEIRNQDLSQSISAATRPLLRQIESLQNSLTSQAQNSERVEKNHVETIASLQQQLAFANEKERTATSFQTDLKARTAVLEDSLQKVKQEREKLLASERDKVERIETLEELLKQEREQATGIQFSLKKSLQNLQNDKIFLEQQLTAERVRVEAEISRVSSEIFNEKARLSRQSSETASSGEQQINEPDVVTSHPPAHSRTSSTGSSQMINDTSFKGASTAVMERLQIQLRQRDGEIHVLQEETQALERTRSALAQELLDMSSRIIELEDECKELEILKVNNKDLQERYAVTLQMYGEKAEEADELRMDLEDVKQMYKQQMQDLFSGR